jgi:AAA15 family ATPase/GTPase
MSENHLHSIHIRNFRLFDSLDIEQVGQVNLISGKNNCGKTTLLEAINLMFLADYDATFFAISAVDLLQKRGDWDENDPKKGLLKLFNAPKEANLAKLNLHKIEFTTSSTQYVVNNKISQIPYGNKAPILQANFIKASFDLENLKDWSKIELTEKEKTVVEVLQSIEKNIERISVDTASKSAKIRVADSPKPIPLKNYGEGMNRLLSIAIGLVNAENNILLIDEIDLGLHHSVQIKLWEIVFSTAKKLNVQVFATTHSNDCIAAFSNVSEKFEGMGNYFRLQKNRDSDGYRAVIYDAEMLESAVYQDIETR